MNHQSPSPGDDANLTVNLTVSLHEVWDEECIIDLKLSNTSDSNLGTLHCFIALGGPV